MKQQSVFISHSSNDDAFVRQLANDLRREGVRTWVDDAQVRPGDDFISKIEEGLTNATHVIIVLSPHSVISDWVREETHAAQIRAVKESARLIPILVGGFGPKNVPLLLRSRLYVDFNTSDDYEASLRTLLSAFATTNDHSETAVEAPVPRIEEINIVSESHGSNLALEILLRNPSYSPISIRKFIARSHASSNRYDYFLVPPTVTYNLDLEIGDVVREGVSGVAGRVTAEGDSWGRPVVGALEIGPYHTSMEISFPLYLELLRQDTGCLRIAVNKFSFSEENLKQDFSEAIKNMSSEDIADWLEVELAISKAVTVPFNHELGYGPNDHSVILFRTQEGNYTAFKTSGAFLFNLIQRPLPKILQERFR